MKKQTEVVVIGAGIVGLATAYKLQQQHPGIGIVVVERESEIAQHQTGHNSGVIHAGVYYKPGSQKAEMCRTGMIEMLEFCEENDVAYTQRGKLIVAITQEELGRLDDLEQRASANGVSSLKRMTTEEMKEIEPAVRGLAAIYSPSTGATDYAEVSRTLRRLIEAQGAEILTGFNTTKILEELNGETVVAADGRRITCQRVVVCGGLQADRLLQARTLKPSDIRIVPFRGSYYDLAERSASLVKSMIYPVPDPRFPFLGVHFTRHVDGQVSVGPNAVLALSRDKYVRHALRLSDTLETLKFGGFWKMAKKYWKTGGEEVIDDFFMKRYVSKARSYVPDANPADFYEGGMGIRAQAVDKAGRLIDDFAFERHGNALFVMNAPSPAATASLAIGEYIGKTLFSDTSSSGPTMRLKLATVLPAKEKR